MGKYSRVVGNNPKFIILNERESVDINTPMEFEIAESLYNLKNK